MFIISGVGKGGISADLPNRDLDSHYVNIAHNVSAAGGSLRVTYGFSELTDTPTIIKHIQPIDDAREPRNMLMISDTHVYGWDGVTVKDITTTGITSPPTGDWWSSSQIGGMALFTHDGETPRAWSPPGGGVEQYIPWNATETWKDKNYTAGIIKNYKNFIVVAHTRGPSSEAPRKVRWSASVTDDYTLPYWDPLPTNDAGEVDLADLSTGVIDMLPLGDGMVIYGSETAYFMQWVGGTYVHRFTKLRHIPGVIGKNMVLPVLNNHFVVGQTDIYLHSGGLPESIVDQKVRKEILGQLNDENLKHSFLVKNWKLDEIWICIPQAGEPFASLAYAWNWVTNTWTTRSIPTSFAAASGVTPVCAGGACPVWDELPYETWEAWPGSWESAGGDLSGKPEVVFAGIDSKLHQRMDSMGPFTKSHIERIGLDMGDYNKEYMLVTAYPSIEGAEAIVQVGVQDSEGAGISWSKPQLFQPGIDKKLDVRSDNLTGTLFCYKVYSEVPSLFEFSGISMVIVEAGRDG